VAALLHGRGPANHFVLEKIDQYLHIDFSALVNTAAS
jgi:hypothetical protein